MFDRFTDRARKVMGLARQEAQRFNHQYIGTEHILLGLIQEGQGVAANVLRNLGVDPGQIRVEVEIIVKESPVMVTTGQLPFTPRTKKVLELSSDWAYKIRHNYIGTEHLLLGLIHENEGVVAQVLMNLGLSLEKVRTETLELLGATMGDEDDSKPDLQPAPRRDPTKYVDSSRMKELIELAANGQKHLFDDYQAFTTSTAIYPGAGTGNYDAMTYIALKSSGECGEFNEKLGKWMRKKGSIKAISRRNMSEEFRLELAKELGDQLWYIAGAATELGYSLSEIVQINIDKLSSRKQRGVVDGEGDNR